MYTSARWRRIQDLCEALEALPARDWDAYLERMEPDQSLRADTRQMLAAVEEEARVRTELACVAGSKPAPLTRLESGDIDGVSVSGILGVGGSGIVYRAVRSLNGVDQPVAVKVFHAGGATPEQRARVLREQRMLVAMSHPAIVRFLDAGVTRLGQPFLLMELAEGSPITQYADAQRLGIDERLQLMMTVIDAVQAAHRQLIVHLDLKPSNILVTPEGYPKLLDFGTARLMDRFGDFTVTAHLTPTYASPEQLRGETPSVACDVYSLGLILAELLTGASPFADRQSFVSVAERAMGRMPRRDLPALVTDTAARARGQSSVRLRATLRGDLDAICARALAHDPGDRYQSVEQFRDDLRRYLDGLPVLARPQTRLYRTRKYLARHWLAMSAAVLFVAALGGAALYSYRQKELARRETNSAIGANTFLINLLGSGHWGSLGRATTLEEFTYLAAKSIDAEGAKGTLAPETEASARAALATTFAANGKYDRAAPEIDRLDALAVQTGSPQIRYQAARIRGVSLFQQGKLADSVKYLRDAYTIALQSLDDESLRLQATMEFATVLGYYDANSPEVVRLHRAVLPLARHAPDPTIQIEALTAACQAIAFSGEWQEGTSYCHEAIAISMKAPEAATIQLAYWVLGIAAAHDDDWPAALDNRRNHFEIVSRTAGVDSTLGRLSRAQLARAEWMTGDRAGALARAQAAADEGARAGDGPWNTLPFEVYADLLARSGRASEAEPWIRRAMKFAGYADPEHDHRSVTNFRTLGSVLAMQGRFDEAAIEFRKALAITQSLRGFEPETRQVAGLLDKATHGQKPY